MNWLRRLWFSGPLSRFITSSLMCAKRSRTASHQRIRQSTRQSLVTLEVMPNRNSSSILGSKMPTGVTVALGSKSWSAAAVGIRLLPPRANGPMLTVAFASIEIRNTRSLASAARLTAATWSKIASVCGTFFGLTLGDFLRIVTQSIEFGANRLGRGQLLIRVAFLGNQLAPHFRSSQPGIQAMSAELRVSLALTVDNSFDISQKMGQMIFGALA